MDDNPYRPPLNEEGMVPGTPDVTKEVGLGFLGFVLAGVISVPPIFLTAMLVTSLGLPGYLDAVIAMQSPVVWGPLSGFVIWYFNRKNHRPFAIGGLVFGVASFLLSGGCGLFLLAI